MSLNVKSVTVALVVSTCCLVACGATRAAPATLTVNSVTLKEAKTLAEQFCSDLAKMTDDDALQRMAVRASEANLSSADQDAVVDYAGMTLCPEQF